MYLNSRWILLIVWLVLRILPNDHCRLRLERAAFAAVDSKAIWLVEVRMRDATNGLVVHLLSRLGYFNADARHQSYNPRSFRSVQEACVWRTTSPCLSI